MSLNSINVNNSSIIGIDNEIKCTDNLVKNEAIYREIISPEIFLDLRFYQFDVNDTTEWLVPDSARLSFVATYVNATIDNPVTMTWNENVKLWFFDGDDPHHLPHTSTEYQDPSKDYVVSPLTLTHSKYIAGTFWDYSVPKDIDYFNVKVKYDNQLSIKQKIDDIIENHLGEVVINQIDTNVIFLTGELIIDEPIRIQSNKRYVGIFGQTKLKLGNADKIFEIISNTENVSIEYITFVGKNKHTSDISMDKTDIRNSTGIGNNNGIYGYGISYNIRIYNCVFEDFDNSGIKLSYTQTSTHGRSYIISKCTFNNNYIGLNLDVRAEFVLVSDCNLSENQIGCQIRGGNNFLSNMLLENNYIGMTVLSGDNNSHGSLSNGSFSHNVRYSVAFIDVDYGFFLSNCQLWQEDILIVNSKGINICGGCIANEIYLDENRQNSMNLIGNVVFMKSYGGGQIYGETTVLKLKNNVFDDGSDNSSINN